MNRIDLDGLTLRYFPWIRMRLIRYVVSFFGFFAYSYLVFPVVNLTRKNSVSFLTFLLFVTFVLADHSYLLNDIPERIPSEERNFEGVLDEYEGRRGLGSAHILVSNEGTRRFKLLTVRGEGNREKLGALLGQPIEIRYVVAKGLITKWKLPILVRSFRGKIIYDYRDYAAWFESPTSRLDRYLMIFFQFLVIFALFFFPAKSLVFLLGQEVRYELAE